VVAPSCWEATQGRGIYVAVIDTGIAPHDDLTGNLLGGVSFVPGETWVDAVSGTIPLFHPEISKRKVTFFGAPKSKYAKYRAPIKDMLTQDP